MNRDPILRARRLPKGAMGNCEMSFKVCGGLRYIKGNAQPHFSLTYWAHRAGRPNQCVSGGAGHDVILQYYPELSDLAAMHLSGIDGEPMYAEENGWYKLAGALGGLGVIHHAGNSKRHFPDGYREPTREECLQLFADHCRVSLDDARTLAAYVSEPINSDAPITDTVRAVLRKRWARKVEGMRPRWKAEARACIAKHSLRVYGDAWPDQIEEAK